MRGYGSATRQNFIPSLYWIAPGWRGRGGAGRDKILLSAYIWQPGLKVNTVWDQFHVGGDSDSLNFLRLGAVDLSHAWVGPSSPSVTVQMNLDQFMDEIR